MPTIPLPYLIAGHVGVHSAMAGLRMATPLFGLALGYGTDVVGYLVALFAVSQIVLALPAGRFADRHGLKLPLCCAALAASTGIGLAVVWPALPALCISALCTGGAVGLSLITLQRHIGRTSASDEQLRRGLAWLSIAPSISIFVGPLVAGLLIDALSFRAAFAVLGLLPLGAWLAARRSPGVPAGSTQEQRSESPWSLWRRPAFRDLLLLNWLMTASWDLHGFMVPVLGHERGLSATWIGVLLSLFALAATFSRLAVPALARRAPEWMIVSSAVTLAAVILGAYPLIGNVVVMAVCSFLLGALLGSIQPSVMILLHKIVPAHRQGDAIAMRLMMVNASGISMPLLFGIAGAWITVAGVFHATAAIVTLGGSIGLARGRRLSSLPKASSNPE